MQTGDGRLVALAGATAAGAWLGMTWLGSGGGDAPGAGTTRIPLGLALVVAALAMASRRPAVICLAAAVLAACLAQRSMAGLTGPVETEDVHAEVTLVSDPRPTPGGGVRVDVRLDGRRLGARAHRSAAAALRNRLAGERVIVVGVRQAPGLYEQRVPHRHLGGRLRIDVVVGWYEGHGITRLANGLRRTLDGGAASLSERQQGLLGGLILGDDRKQPSDLTGAFRGAGLAHLLAVSGQNVAFLLTAVSPLLARLRLASRLVVTLLVLGLFALMTRGEPSVLRATAMAGLGAYSAATGRPSSGLRRLSLAVTVLLLCDPLLVSSLGFQLSVAGAAGIIVGARPIADRLPGPRALRLPAAVTVAAELATAPVLALTLGAVPLVSLPANLLAAPAAGPVKLWGITGGLAAGVLGHPLATLLHVPTRALLLWLDQVATRLEALRLGELRAEHVAALAIAAAVVTVGGRIRFATLATAVRAGGMAVVAVTLGAALVAAAQSQPQQGYIEVGSGMELWRAPRAAVVVIDGRARAEWLLPELRRHGVDHVDVVILRTSSHRAVAVANRLRDQWPATTVLAPPAVTEHAGGRIPGAATPHPGPFELDGLRLSFDVAPDRLEPEIAPSSGAPPEATGGAVRSTS
jgi:competence protein ComEC